MAQESITRDHKELAERLWSWKNKGKFCDASLSVNGQSIPVHAVVLASFSQFFENAFDDSKMTPKEVTFTDVDMNTMQSLIEYCYKGSLDINENNALEMYQMASILEVSSVAESSAKVLKNSLKSENCLSIWKMADVGENDALKKYVVPFIKENIDKVSQSDEFLSLDYSEVKQIFSSDAKVDSEIEVFDALKRWIKHDDSRSKHSNELLDYIKLEYLPKSSIESGADSICGLDGLCLKKFLAAALLQKNEYSSKFLSTNTLIVMGGNDTNQSQVIEIYDINSKKWAKINYGECLKYYYAIAPIDDKIMIIGGNSSNGKSVEYYDLKTGQTESLPQLKYKRDLMPAITFEGDIYVFGGRSDDKSLSSVEKWSPIARTWQEVAPMTVPREGSGAAVLDDEIYVVGGWDGSNYSSVTEAYNPKSDTWKRCNDMNEKKCFHGLAALKGFIYAVGGKNPHYLKTVEKYDKCIDKWTVIQPLNALNQGLAAGNLNGQLVITGGYSFFTFHNSVEAYDEKNNKWITLASMNRAHCHHCVVQVPWTLAELALARKS